uniref:Uncharacterized protein n=1 Tax=Lepeophtheirus salmonis TaxID=72036 RepID=A0A0K2VGB7_LEPSM
MSEVLPDLQPQGNIVNRLSRAQSATRCPSSTIPPESACYLNSLLLLCLLVGTKKIFFIAIDA